MKSLGSITKDAGLYLVLLFTLLMIGEVHSQDIEMNLVQKRRFDQIHVELWAKALNANAPTLGFASLVVDYDPNFLQPAAEQEQNSTDSLHYILDQDNPIIDINSPMHQANGYNALQSRANGTGKYSLEVNLAQLGVGGLVPSTDGRGSFVGKMIFDIISNPADTSLTGITWSKTTLPGDIVVFDADSNDVETQFTFTDPSDFTVLGITILTPNWSIQTVDRDKDYASLKDLYAEQGYPIIFERTVNPSDFSAPSGGVPAMDETLGYLLEYTIDDGNSWYEIGRVAETDRSATGGGSGTRYATGEIFVPNQGSGYIITSDKGDRLGESNYRRPVRVIWTRDKFFTNGSENATIKITRLEKEFTNGLLQRSRTNELDTTDEKFSMGSLFFLQLDGTDDYLKSDMNFSNATQLTVEAWVNLNSYNAAGSEPAIIASSAGPDAAEINGSTEGSWMLYLSDGQFPAFRVRELLGRGTNGYLADLVAIEPLATISDAKPLVEGHSENWAHIAATVHNNEVILYVNGEIVKSYRNTDHNDVRMLTTNHPLWVGINPNIEITEDDYLNAGIKEIKIWRNALTQEELRQRAVGVVDPNNIAVYGDLRRGLEVYYTFKGVIDDQADDVNYQKGDQLLNFYNAGAIDNMATLYRPDRPHIIITSPKRGVGISSLLEEPYEIRWLSFGIGDIENLESNDIEIEYSTDAGQNWTFVKNEDGESYTGENAPDVELGRTNWSIEENDELLNINPYSKAMWLRIRGTEENKQDQLIDLTGEFTFAPYFSVKRELGTIMFIPGDQGMNITANTHMFEAWVRPYRFPTADEGYMPILAKVDSTAGNSHYNLRLLENGQLQFDLTDNSGAVRSALSDVDNALVAPNSIDLDSAWTHVAVYLFTNGGSGQSKVMFYIDGTPQTDAAITDQLGTDLAIDGSNTYETFIGYMPSGVDGDAQGFLGEIRGLRFWSGVPANKSTTGQEPTELTTFLQGAQTVRSEELKAEDKQNMVSAFSFNGGSFINDGIYNTVKNSAGNTMYIYHYRDTLMYLGTEPYLKLVEPVFKQKVPNSQEDLRVRWVGFDYDAQGFASGRSNTPPAVAFSIRGGGGDIIQPYQYVGSDYWGGIQEDAMSFPNNDLIRFEDNEEEIYIATQLNAAIADPDENNDGAFNDQGPLSASNTNARLRLTGQYTLFNQTNTWDVEGPLFSVTPASNFTIRVLLEGYHNGEFGRADITDLATSYDEGGLKIKLYRDNAGLPGALVDSSESEQGYDELDPANRGAGNRRFANVNFIFTELADDYYWVLVEHLNHLPVMSRFPAQFMFEGDERTTWEIESGWDFQSWNGEDNNIIPDADTDPWASKYYTAYGDAVSTTSSAQFSTTGLIYNNGVAGEDNKPMPAMVGGDVTHDGQINAADRVRVRIDDGTSTRSSDVTGDGVVNADDRTITDRNFGHVSSVYNIDFAEAVGEDPVPAIEVNPFNVISELDPERSREFNEAALRKNALQKTKVMRKEVVLASGIKYTVSGEAEYNGQNVDLSLYIKNDGADWAPANCTFAVSYNSSVLEWDKLIKNADILFDNKAEYGYATVKSAPKEGATDPVPDVRTIEIDYDSYENPGGIIVPNEKTYLGTLRFNIKDATTSISFTWHEMTSIHSTEGSILTDDGVFEDIESILLYTAEIVSPNGGEAYAPGDAIPISWTSDGTAPITLQFSSNDGYSWTDIVSDIPANQLSYAWTAPDISSTDCFVRIIDKQSGEELDRSDENFSIQQKFAMIIRPSSGDAVYTGGTNDEIRWTSSGWGKVYFEFSADGGTSWTGATSTVMASESEISWKLPEVTTKQAMVRMVNSETNEVIVESRMFKILNGYMSFKEPRSGDVFTVETKRRVRWSSSDVDEFDLQLSIDGGQNWTFVEKALEANDVYYDWNVWNKPTKNAVFRAIWNSDPEMEYARSAYFEIELNPGFVEIIPNGWEISDIYPNPADKEISIDINANIEKEINIKIISIEGKVQLNKNVKLSGTSEERIQVDVSSLSIGSYYLLMSGKEIKLIRTLNIIR